MSSLTVEKVVTKKTRVNFIYDVSLFLFIFYAIYCFRGTFEIRKSRSQSDACSHRKDALTKLLMPTIRMEFSPAELDGM